MSMFQKITISAACLLAIIGWTTASNAEEVTGKITKLREGSDKHGNLRVRLRSKDGSKIRLRFRLNQGNEAIIDGKAAQPRDLKVNEVGLAVGAEDDVLSLLEIHIGHPARVKGVNRIRQ